jgi:hypothetical protein
MSRSLKKINDRYSIITGVDHVLGSFIQIVDQEFIGHEKDFGGEGYVFDWDVLFGTTKSHLVDHLGKPYKPKGIQKSSELIKEIVSLIKSGKVINKFIEN